MLPKNYIKPTEYAAGGAKKKTKSGSPKPTNPSLWSRAKALAKQKFDVYPSAYANGWAAKWYKENGGGWSGGSNKKAEGGPFSKIDEPTNTPQLLRYLENYTAPTPTKIPLSGIKLPEVLVLSDPMFKPSLENKAQFLDDAFIAAQNAAAGTGLFPEVIAAMAANESGYGKSGLTKEQNNYFGIRQHRNTPEQYQSTRTWETDEYVDGEKVRDRSAKFEVHPSFVGSMEAFVDFLKRNSRYSEVFKASNPYEQLELLKKAGYRTGGWNNERRILKNNFGIEEPSEEKTAFGVSKLFGGPLGRQGSYRNTLANGGPVNYQQGGSPDKLMQIQNGGTHEESSLGGVPMGTDAEGNQVLVEEGETVRKGSETDFVFSDRLRLTKQDAEEFAIDKKFVGQTFADISKKLETRSRRKNDPIDKQTIDIQLNRLEEAQEVFKQRKLAEAQEMYGGSREPSPEQSMEPPMGSPMEGPMGSPMGAPQGPSPEEMAIMQAMQQGAAGMGPQGMGQPSPEMMPPQGPPQMMNYGGLIYANGGPTENLLEVLKGNYKKGGLPMEENSLKDIAYKNYLKTQGLSDHEIMEIKMGGNLENTVNNFYRDSLPTSQSTQAAAAPPTDSQQIYDLQMANEQALESLYPENFATDPMYPQRPPLSAIQEILPFLDNRYPQQSAQTASQMPGVPDPNAQTSASSTVAAPNTTTSAGAAAPVTANDAPPAQSAVQPAPVSTQTSELPMELGAINFGATGPYSTQKGNLVIPSGSNRELLAALESMPGPLGANRGTQPEMPTYETPLWVTGMQGAPVATNLLSSILSPKGFNYEDYRVSPDDTIIQKPDITPDLQDIDKMTQLGRQAITARATSTGELLVGLSRLTSIGMAEIGKVRNQQYSDYLQQLEAQKLRNLQLAQFNSQTKGAVDAANADLEKERLSLINAAATEASKVADALRQENLSKYEIEVLYKMYPYLTQYNTN